jgi:hypothetical protein
LGRDLCARGKRQPESGTTLVASSAEYPATSQPWLSMRFGCRGHNGRPAAQTHQRILKSDCGPIGDALRGLPCLPHERDTPHRSIDKRCPHIAFTRVLPGLPCCPPSLEVLDAPAVTPRASGILGSTDRRPRAMPAMRVSRGMGWLWVSAPENAPATLKTRLRPRGAGIGYLNRVLSALGHGSISRPCGDHNGPHRCYTTVRVRPSKPNPTPGNVSLRHMWRAGASDLRVLDIHSFSAHPH